MLTISFWKGAAERAAKTFIQSFVATLLASIGAVVSAWEVPWSGALTAALGVAVLSAVLSLATSVGNADFTAGKAPDATAESDDFSMDQIDEITTVTKYRPAVTKYQATGGNKSTTDSTDFDSVAKGN
ncbi:holin [Glutamicibacter ardleyensis]|uniref:Holin n=1 Tax=Glutamicibacter ardleyensis TaxID=225894 RepID=A0ABQ2DIR7_9MICC|nr:holin [Glutamicibacter ardleyensis]GGJ58627.1 hypothetical protein GCM10007173_16720 [Glutamicibacter ardleyensis]